MENNIITLLDKCKDAVIKKDIVALIDSAKSHWDYDSGYSTKETIKEEVVILQVCIFGEDYMLAEYVFKKDMK